MKGRKELHFVHMVVVMVLLGGWAEEGGEGGRELGGRVCVKVGRRMYMLNVEKQKRKKRERSGYVGLLNDWDGELCLRYVAFADKCCWAGSCERAHDHENSSLSAPFVSSTRPSTTYMRQLFMYTFMSLLIPLLYAFLCIF